MNLLLGMWMGGAIGGKSAAVDPADLQIGCEAYYALDDNGNDSSTNARHLNAGLSYTTGGILGQCTRDGSGAKNGIAVAAVPMTLSCWFRPGGTLGDGNGEWSVWSQDFSRMFGVRAIRNDIGSVARVRTVFDNVAGDATSTITLNAWSHVALICESTGCRLFLNGQLSQTLAAKTSFTAENVWIDPTTSRMFIDECAWWSRALSFAEVAALYNGGVGLNPY